MKKKQENIWQKEKHKITMNKILHKPVLINEIIEALNVRDELTYVDATFGFGSYTKRILEKANCKVLSIDRDPDVKILAKDVKKKYKERFEFISNKFSNIKSVLETKGLKIISGGLVADLGFSTMQINNPLRGFSFLLDGPLDMRMSKNGDTAKDIVNSLKETELSNIFWKYGEEKKSRQIAKQIIRERKTKTITTTFQLVNIIRKVIKRNNSKIHPATRVFQAIRIYVNKELNELEQLIKNSEELLLPGARIAIVSFHSLEDRIIKVLFNELSGNASNANRHLPDRKPRKKIKFKKIYKKVIRPKNSEIEKNIKSRSAKLRVLERVHS